MVHYYLNNGLRKTMNNLLKQTMKYLENMPQEKIEKGNKKNKLWKLKYKN